MTDLDATLADIAVVEKWIADLRVDQEECPATPKGYRMAALLAHRIGTLQHYINCLRDGKIQ